MIAVIVRCYYLTDYLKAVLKSYAWADKVLVANYRFTGVTVAKDNTQKICEELNQPNVILKKGKARSQLSVFNLCQDELKGSDLIFINDADELLERKDQEKIVKGMSKVYGVCNIVDYIDREHIYLPRKHYPLIAIRPPVKWTDIRRCEGIGKSFQDITLHHFGYMMNHKEWKEKNLWSSKKSYDDITSKPIIPYEMPEEIRNLLEEK